MPLVTPRRVMTLGWMVSVLAGASVGMAALMQDLPTLLALLLFMLPLLAHGLGQLRLMGRHDRASLEVSPHEGWALKHAGRSQAMRLQWGSRHVLGLTLYLKYVQCPHKKWANQTFTVWRWTADAEDYRRLCVMYAWFIRQPYSINPGETQ